MCQGSSWGCVPKGSTVSKPLSEVYSSSRWISCREGLALPKPGVCYLKTWLVVPSVVLGVPSVVLGVFFLLQAFPGAFLSAPRTPLLATAPCSLPVSFLSSFSCAVYTCVRAHIARGMSGVLKCSFVFIDSFSRFVFILNTYSCCFACMYAHTCTVCNAMTTRK